MQVAEVSGGVAGEALEDAAQVMAVGEAAAFGNQLEAILGVNQAFDSAALDIYAHATFWDFKDDSGYTYEDLSTFLVGSRIKF